MGCVLHVSGKRFDASGFLTGSTLEPYSVFEIGEPIRASRPEGKVHDASGFKVEVSRGSWDSLRGQVPDAIAFLKKHKRTLAKLRRMPEVEDIRLDFGIDLRIDRKKVFAQFDFFPPELVSLAGGLGCGLELSTYPRDLERLARTRTRRLRERSDAAREYSGTEER